MITSLNEEMIHKKSPQELTHLLYKVIIERLNLAIDAINEKKFDKANMHLQKCNDLVYRLGAGINYEAGIISDQLEVLYQYVADTLIEANIKKDVPLIQEVIRIVTDISDAWEQAMQDAKESTTANRSTRHSAYESSYEATSLDIRE